MKQLKRLLAVTLILTELLYSVGMTSTFAMDNFRKYTDELDAMYGRFEKEINEIDNTERLYTSEGEHRRDKLVYWQLCINEKKALLELHNKYAELGKMEKELQDNIIKNDEYKVKCLSEQKKFKLNNINCCEQYVKFMPIFKNNCIYALTKSGALPNKYEESSGEELDI